ncbi:hemolysin family protein [Sulfurirhabdus autotrophica]|uniref:Putative hemolysin n=1 Tax=Sulfurirhabdus autotrophica TaxID=1706046 RepID=A0A4R3Y103_9PROT|nr:hemolysin family protein [Sulfurirhabdus autotrophica]TCV85157.1 putative hemolysin [Sulfurirhabdus autotrophica]
MNALWILVLLIVLSGFFALAEMALASSRRGKLIKMANEGHKGASAAITIKEHPSRLLAATQTGITAAALLMGIYGESALSASVDSFIPSGFAFLTEWRGTISFTITIIIVTAVSIILGEIVPKRIAIAHPERVAAMCAPFMAIFIRMLSPAIHFLSWTADRILAILPIKSAPAVTSVEDILAFVDEGFKVGAIASEESHLLGNVLRLEDRRLAAIMTPTADVTYLDLLAPRERNLRLLREAPHSQLPVCKGDLQQVIGIAESHDILQAAMEGNVDFAELPLATPLFVPGTLTLIDLLRTLRQQKVTFALVVTEFGVTEGIVTLDDVMMSLVGEMMPLGVTSEEALAVRRPDGSWLLDGLLAIDEMKDKLEIRSLPHEDLGNFHTVGGFVLASLGRIPRKSEQFSCGEWDFEVVDVDRNRVDQILAIRHTEPGVGNN